MTLALATALLLSSPTASAAPVGPPDGPELSSAYVAEVNDRWGGVGLGFDMGLWGSRFGTSFKADLPFGSGRVGQHLGMRVRSLSIHDDFEGSFNPVVAGGAELFGRGPVVLGIVRVYGGGGFYYGGTLGRTEHVYAPALVGAGHFGLEVAASPRQSFTFEVGGQGPMSAEGIDEGASVMAGTTLYLGKVKR